MNKELAMSDATCDCPGSGHDPATCATTEHLCRDLWPNGRKICGLDRNHESPHAWEPRAWTPAEMKEKFMRLLLETADAWARCEGKTPQERCEGVAFSMLAAFDGAGDFPAVDLVLRPHEDAKAWRQGQGENWIEGGTVINDHDYLHDEWHDFVRRVRDEDAGEPHL